MKKIVVTFAVCLMLCLTALVGFACGSNVDKSTVFEQVKTLVEKMESEKSDVGMFLSGEREANGVKSNFVLSYYASDPVYSYLSDLFVIPMNYIVTYYPDLERLGAADNISGRGQELVNNLASAASDMTYYYNLSQENYTLYKSLALPSYSPKVVEGALTIYKQSLKQLIKDVYSVANSIADIKAEVFNDFYSLRQSNRQLEVEDSVALRDYVSLEIATDYYNALIENLGMNDYTDKTAEAVKTFVDLNRSLKSGLKELYTLQALGSESFVIFTGSAKKAEDGTVLYYDNVLIDTLFDARNAMENERQMLSTALSTFNLSAFYENYSCSLKAYASAIKNADNYFQEILDFYTKYSVSYVQQLVEIFTTAPGV